MGSAGMGDLMQRGASRVEKNSIVKSAQGWAVQGWVKSWEEGSRGKKSSMAKSALAWVVRNV